MKLAIIKRTSASAYNRLNADGFKFAARLIRASVADLEAERDIFHLNNCTELAREIMEDKEIGLTEHSRNKLKAMVIACEVVTAEEQEKK